MAWLSILTLITALSLHGQLPSGNSVFQGRVITESGEPIQGAGVLLVNKGAPEIEVGNYVGTDETGTFHLKRFPEAIYVKKEGYFPQLFRLLSSNQNPLVVMHHVDNVLQAAPPACSGADSNEKLLRVGNGFRLTISRELTVESTDNPKVPYAALAYRKNPLQRMTIYWGTEAILGFPQIEVLANTPELVVRGEADISGTTADGKHWRWMSEGGDHIEYFGVSAEAADLFDRQLASLCHINEGEKPH